MGLTSYLLEQLSMSLNCLTRDVFWGDETKKYEVEESNVYFNEFVKSLTSEGIKKYDIDGKSLTVLKILLN